MLTRRVYTACFADTHQGLVHFDGKRLDRGCSLIQWCSEWQVPHMGCYGSLHGGGLLFTGFLPRTWCSRRAVCHPKRGQIPNANWQLHIPAVSIWVPQPAERFCDLFHQGTGSQNFTALWWWSRDPVPLPTTQRDHADCRDIKRFFMARVFWLPLTTGTCNHSTDRFLTLLLNPGISATWGYKNSTI